jgi:hypothetical protein
VLIGRSLWTIEDLFQHRCAENIRWEARDSLKLRKRIKEFKKKKGGVLLRVRALLPYPSMFIGRTA